KRRLLWLPWIGHNARLWRAFLAKSAEHGFIPSVGSGRHPKLNSIHAVGLLSCGNIKIGKRHFLGRLLVDDPDSFAGYGIVLDRELVPITKDQNGIGRRLLRRH